MGIVVVPLDDRPVTRLLPMMIGAVAGTEVKVPPLELLGSLGRAADTAGLGTWLLQHSGECSGAIISLDMLGHGGLIPSRRSDESAESVVARLQPVLAMRAQHPEIPIMAFNIVQRVSNADDSQEEKPYWRQYGKAIFRLSQLTDAVARFQRESDIAELAEIERAVPSQYLADYLRTRSRNHAVNRLMVQWTATGVFTYLALTQDDANPLGFPAIEQRELSGLVSSLDLFDRVGIYPGADEVASSLLAKLLCRTSGFTPRVFVRWSSVRGPLIIANYEDRPLGESVKSHILAAGGLIADAAADADLVLMCNSPAEAQAEAPDGVDYLRVHTAGRNLDEFILAAQDYLSRGKPVAIADVAYSNGADPELPPRMLQAGIALQIVAYAAWNTAGNTLGSTLAHAFARMVAFRCGPRTAEEDRAHLLLLMTRYLDDWIYQTVIRSTAGVQDLEREYQVSYSDLGNNSGSVEIEVGRALQEQFVRWFGHMPPADLYTTSLPLIRAVAFPWNRLFEIDIKLH